MTMLLRLAWRNLGRNKRRTGLTTAAAVFATVLSMFNLAIGDGSHERWIDHTVRLYPGHYEVSLAGYRDNRTLDYALALSPEQRAGLDSLPDADGWAPRLETFGLISADVDRANGRGVQLFGLEGARERRLSKLVAAVGAGRLASDGSDSREIALGDQLAKNLGVGLGDSVIIVAADAYGSQSADRFRVVGTFHVGEDELDGFGALVELSELQSFLEAGESLSHVAVFARDSERLPPIGARLDALFPASQYEVLPWPELVPDLVQFMRLDDVGNWVGNGILIVVVGFGLLNTILMSVFERVREFGVLRALGLRPRAVFALVVIESLELTLLGIAMGMAIGVPAILWLAQHPIPLTSESLKSSMDVFDLEPVLAFALARDTLVVLPLILLGVGVVAALPPAIRASRGRPVDALRAN